MIISAIILGIIQGLTEFLPISSSGHLLLVGRIMGDIPSVAFELSMHLATLLAVVIVYFKDIVGLIRHPFSKPSRLIMTATIPTVIIVFLGNKLFKASFDGQYLSFCFMVTGILLLMTGFVKHKVHKPIGYLDAIIIGSVQGIAAFPGISRSGSTICTASLLGKEKSEACKFSFILSIPIILGSSIVEIGGGGGAYLGFLPIFFGFISAFLSGLFALKVVVKVLTKHNFDGFAVYLLLLSAFLMVNDFALHLF